jgi:hypothetical protein
MFGLEMAIVYSCDPKGLCRFMHEFLNSKAANPLREVAFFSNAKRYLAQEGPET